MIFYINIEKEPYSVYFYKFYAKKHIKYLTVMSDGTTKSVSSVS